MGMLIYSTGNGYHCHCCRRTDQDYTYFDSNDIDSLIDECISIAKSSDWDFSVVTIEGYVGEEDLETKIDRAVADAEKAHNLARKIDDLKKQISSIDGWFNTLDDSKVRKQKERDDLIIKLKELEA